MDEKNYNGFDPERLENFENEADYIMDGLRNDAKFRHRFIFGTDPKKCNMARLRSKIIKDIKENNHVIVSDETFNEIVYLALWAGGSWKTLDTYSKQCTFFAWLRRVAKNAVMERLEDEHWITVGRARTVGNTRLTMLSQSETKCQLVLDELMVGTKYYDLLVLIYVDRLPQKDVIKKMKMKVEEYEEIKKMADNKLKDALLRSDYSFEQDVLHDKSGRVVTVSSEFVADIAEWCKVKTGVNPLSDVFGIGLTDEEVRVKTVEFLYDFSSKLKWSDEDRYIWQQRFMENAAPVELAKEVGRSRGWLDTRYSRLNKKFDKAIRKWWFSHAA
jgi:hypothetical protein